MKHKHRIFACETAIQVLLQHNPRILSRKDLEESIDDTVEHMDANKDIIGSGTYGYYIIRDEDDYSIFISPTLWGMK